MFAELNHGIKLHVPLLNIPIDKEMNDAKSAIIITLNISILYLIHNVNCVCTTYATNEMRFTLYVRLCACTWVCYLSMMLKINAFHQSIQENNYVVLVGSSFC